VVITAAAILHGSAGGARAADKDLRRKISVVVFDFVCGEGDYGKKLSDSIRLRLRRHEEYFVLDRFSTADIAKPTGADADRKKVTSLLKDKLAATVGIYGTVTVQGKSISAEVVCINFTNPDKPADWTKTLSDSSQRARGLIARWIVEALTGKEEWVPPQYGDEEEPKKFGRPLNLNGGFEKGHTGWDPPDLAATFLIDGPKGRGKVLKVLTTVNRDQWIAYRRRLRMGAKPTKDHGVTHKGGSVAGLEGVHYRGMWIKATPGQRYWLTADKKGPGAKIFIKGFVDWSQKANGLPESSLARLGLTPEKFAELPRKKQRRLIAADAKAHPERYRRECYRWYLNCGGGDWKHFAAPFPPRGGLPKYVQWLQVQIYSYWPPGEYLWDNVHVCKDPRQTAPLPEVNARTKNYKTITTTRPAAKRRK